MPPLDRVPDTGACVNPDANAEIHALVQSCIPLARRLARRFTGRGESLEDLEQVAYLGLTLAAARFDPVHGVRFATYATPTILGELRRHLRDKGWVVRPTRRIQELCLRIHRAGPELSQALGGTPNLEDMANHLEIAPSEIREALVAGDGYRPAPLDPIPRNGDRGPVDCQSDGRDETALADRRVDLGALLAPLTSQERLALYLRFALDLSESEIGRELDMSQPRVSRMLRRLLVALRVNAGPGTEDLQHPTHAGAG
jgi:RNA polymerase sigma-B factor